MTLEELTAENLDLKEQLATLKSEHEKTATQNKEYESTIVNLRSKNAELYSRIGVEHEPPVPPKSEAEKKNEFWGNYIKEKKEK